MDDTGNVQSCSCPYDRYADKTAFGKDDVGTDPLQMISGLYKALDDTEGVSQIFHIQIAPELAGRNSIVRDIKICDQLLLNSVIGANIGYFITQLLQMGNQRNIGGNVPGGSTACQHDFFDFCIAHESLLFIDCRF